ncbi:hypothetical protein CLV37_110192 [Kineococcus rhizosphaerae]|uniref:Uncharacterized protein n=1 Tax=Kineococcus rhizosphaerae TaxID=559628 RepID=A0A2T0R0H9_9ACTN|nr:hypothetical protein CLV37_110192 [Kineococcus rhizosphaerae]
MPGQQDPVTCVADAAHEVRQRCARFSHGHLLDHLVHGRNVHSSQNVHTDYSCPLPASPIDWSTMTISYCTHDGCKRRVARESLCERHWKVRARQRTPKCTFEQCENHAALHSNGLCSGHEQQRRRGVKLQPLRQRLRRGTPCAVEDCSSAARARGLCGEHFVETYPLPDSATVDCVREGCSKPSKARGLCAGHHTEYSRAIAAECSVDNCAAPVCARSRCNQHYKEDLARERGLCSIAGCSNGIHRVKSTEVVYDVRCVMLRVVRPSRPAS